MNKLTEKASEIVHLNICTASREIHLLKAYLSANAPHGIPEEWRTACFDKADEALKAITAAHEWSDAIQSDA